MADSTKIKHLEFKSVLKYYYSKFDFTLKVENNNNFKLTLIYSQIVEYSSEYNFKYIQDKKPAFKTIFEFFEFLNDSNIIKFYISEIKKEYCKLILYFNNDSYNEFTFNLMNRNNNLDFETYKEKKLLYFKPDELINLCKESNSEIILNDILFEYRSQCYCFNYIAHPYIIFISKIKLEIYKDNKKIIEEYIKTNYNIKEIIKNNNINERDVYFENYTLEEIINIIDLYIKNDLLKLKIIERVIPKATFGQEVLNINKEYKRENYSKYFSEYFENYNPNNNHKIFKYEKNELRNEIFDNIIKLRNTKEINQYRITGPCSSGKSITLFIFSKTQKNVIYINLKILRKYRDDYKKCLEIIFSESSRVSLDENIFNQKIQLLKIHKKILYQLLDIIKIFLDSTNENIILIIDQYKEYKAHNNDEIYFIHEIFKLLKEKTNLNIVLCSSLSDSKTSSKVIETWTDFNGNPSELNELSQNYYFYYNKLFTNKNNNTFLFQYFRNNYKYIKKAIKYGGILNLYNKIIQKLQTFINSLKFYFENINFCDILIFLKNYINIERKKLNKYDFMQIIKLTPLQYFSVEITKDNIKIKPIFPFISYCISKYINMKDCDEYYENNYIILNYFSQKIRENYFEYVTMEALQNNLIIELPFDYNKKTEEVILNEIIFMDKIEKSFNDIVEEFSEIIKNNNQIFYLDNEENDNNIYYDEEEVEENNNKENIYIVDDEFIIIDLNRKIDEEILDKKIEEIIANYYLKDFTKNYQEEIKKVNKLEKYFNIIAEESREYLKDITDFKKEIYKKIIIERKEEILKIIKDKRDKKRKIKIPISNIIHQKNSKYTGDENFMIKQGNNKGFLFDSAILYGKREHKIFVGFQIISYPINEILYEKLLDRHLFKSTLSYILIHSIKTFNCLIKEWHYFPIIYFNNRDPYLDNIGYQALLFSMSREKKILLYNPYKKAFYADNFNPIVKLELSNFSNMDSSSALNNDFNFFRFPLNFFSEENYEKYKIINDLGIHNFQNDFIQYSEKYKDILDILSKKLGVKHLIYSFYFHFDRVEYPLINFMYLYKKKQSSYFIAIFQDKELKIIDLETEKNIESNDYYNLIDLDYKYVYILRFEGETRKRKGSDGDINPDLLTSDDKSKIA